MKSLYIFQVNETCLSGDHRTFLVFPNDKDSHNPILIHITPVDMTHNERRTYVPSELKMARKERRKEKQKANKRKSHEPSDYGGDEGYYGQSSSSSSWRPEVLNLATVRFVAFHRLGILPESDFAFRTMVQKEFGSRHRFSFRHVFRTFVTFHRPTARSVTILYSYRCALSAILLANV